MADYSEDDAFETAEMSLSQRAMAPLISDSSIYMIGLNNAQIEAVNALEGGWCSIGTLADGLISPPIAPPPSFTYLGAATVPTLRF